MHVLEPAVLEDPVTRNLRVAGLVFAKDFQTVVQSDLCQAFAAKECTVPYFSQSWGCAKLFQVAFVEAHAANCLEHALLLQYHALQLTTVPESVIAKRHQGCRKRDLLYRSVAESTAVKFVVLVLASSQPF